MVSMRDYSQSNPVITQRYEPLSLKFLPFVGQTIIVFVDGGGQQGSGFTGVLVEVLSDSIKLVTKLPPAPNTNRNRCRNKTPGVNAGVHTIILTSHITAFSYVTV